MIKQPANWRQYFTSILGLCLGLALQADAQQRGGGGTAEAALAGAVSAAAPVAAAPAPAPAAPRGTYPNNTTIGDAYFSIDPETHRVVYIADEATAKYIGQVLTNLDRPKPQVLIKVVFLEVTLNDASDIGVEGSFNKSIGSSPSSGLVTNFTVVTPARKHHCPHQHNSRPRPSLRVHLQYFSACRERSSAFSAAPTVSIKSSVRITP